MIKGLKYSLLVCAVVFAAACAIRVAPTGGPKDEIPPKLVSASPDTFSTNFNSPTIEFEFDEYFQLNDLSGRLVVSPPLEKAPIAKIKGKKLLLELQEPLKPNTTYNFNFGNAIADVNENKAMNGFNYIISTGGYIDSLKTSGVVTNAYTGLAEKDVTVLLYKGNDDSLPYKEKPAYFTKTIDGGAFTIDYIAPGKYKMFALKETNNNYLVDNDEELIAFSDSLLDVSQNKTTTLKLFLPKKSKQKLLKKQFALPGKLTLRFNRPVTNLNVQNFFNPTDTAFYITETNPVNDSLTLWLTNKFADTLKYIVSDGGVVLDTFAFNNVRAVKRGGRKGSGETVDTTLTLNYKNLKGGKLDMGNNIVLRFNHPVDSIDFSQIKLLSEGMGVEYKGSIGTALKRELTITYPFKEEVNYKLEITKGAIKDIFGFKNDSLNTSFTLKSERDYGSLTLTITLPEKGGNYIFHLLNTKGDILKEMRINSSQKIDFGLLEPAIYSFRLIEDLNNNGRWDTGNYFSHIQPEVVYYSTEKPNVRAAWELDAEWKLNGPAKAPEKKNRE